MLSLHSEPCMDRGLPRITKLALKTPALRPAHSLPEGHQLHRSIHRLYASFTATQSDDVRSSLRVAYLNAPVNVRTEISHLLVDSLDMKGLASVTSSTVRTPASARLT